MKRKDYRNIDPVLVDEGWKEMKKVLDREMPEKRRWRLFIWIPALAAASIAGFVLITTLNFNGADDFDLQDGQSPLATIEPDLSEINKMSENAVGDEEVSTAISKAGVTDISNKETISPISEAKVPFVETKVDHQPEKNQISRLDVRSFPVIELSKLPSLKIKDIALAYSNTGGQDISVANFSHSPRPVFEPEKIEVRSLKPDLTPGFAVGSGAHLPSDKFSWIAGPSLEVSWKKLFLKTTIQYWNIFTRKSFVLNETSGAFTEAANIRTSSSQDQVGVAQPIETVYSEYDIDQIQYFKTSVKTGYFHDSKISPVIGVSTVVLLSDKIKFESGRPPSSFNNQQAKAFTEQDILRRTNIAFDIGLNYRISSNFTLSLNYTHPWHSYLKPQFTNASSANVTRQVLMGIHFQFD